MQNLINDIQNANHIIDFHLQNMNKSNRGIESINILKSLRDLNDTVALKLYKDLYPEKNMTINKAAQQFMSKDKEYKFIAKLDKYVQKSLSHFTPSEDGAERLILKYYPYMLKLKSLVKNKYNLDILIYIDNFLPNLDTQTLDYYKKVAITIDNNKIKSQDFDNYYIDKIKPFFINNKIYYEVTLEPAEDKINKFNRVTAFTNCDISSNYAVALSFVDAKIHAFNTFINIKLITDWNISIRPCEFNNFMSLINMNYKIQRNNIEYSILMQIMKDYDVSLIDIIELDDINYQKINSYISNKTKNKISYIFKMLTVCRNANRNDIIGQNILKYLLLKMNNYIIKLQKPIGNEKCLGQFNISSKCYPFEKYPYAFNPTRHKVTIYELFECIDSTNKEPQMLYKYLTNNAENNATLYTNIDTLIGYYNKEEINDLIKSFNDSLYDDAKPCTKIEKYKDYIYINKYEQDTLKIFSKLKSFSLEENPYKEFFNKNNIDRLESLEYPYKLDDDNKKDVLYSMHNISRIHLIDGAAGTGKSTLLNYIAYLLDDIKKFFIAQTNPAVDNLRHKIKSKSTMNSSFSTIEKFKKEQQTINYFYHNYVLVIDECSTIKNEDILFIIDNLPENSLVILTGDVHQIEAIGYGNWFGLIKNILPNNCRHTLLTPYRSNDEYLIELWKEVRENSNVNVITELLVRYNYSSPINEDIFNKKSDDEIILCLNYNGLYGLNNINKLLQLNNPNKAFTLGIWQYKINDPILFNDSRRFNSLYNNLKGIIKDIVETPYSLIFTIKVATLLDIDDIKNEDGLELITLDNKFSTIRFKVDKRKPYMYDEEPQTNYHIMPFQVAYAVSIHKSQGLEYDSVKIVISNDSEEQITHNIFYTAITRTKKHLQIYWSPETCNKVLSNIVTTNKNKDFLILKNKFNF